MRTSPLLWLTLRLLLVQTPDSTDYHSNSVACVLVASMFPWQPFIFVDVPVHLHSTISHTHWACVVCDSFLLSDFHNIHFNH